MPQPSSSWIDNDEGSSSRSSATLSLQATPPSVQIGSHGTLFSTPGHEIDPFRHETLRKATVDIMVHDEAAKILGSLDKMRAISDSYFNSVHHRMSILSKGRVDERLQDLSASAPADFVALCLSMLLVQQQPLTHTRGMQSSLYIVMKSVISLLEAVKYQSLEIIQCRLLLTFYEMGHGMFPAASLSIGACSRLARFIGLERTNTKPTESMSAISLEEQKRTLWAILNLDR